MDKSRILLPGQQIQIPVEMEDGVTVSVEPWEQNKNDSWPEPQLQSISEGNISLINSTNDSIMLGKEVKKIKVRGTTEVKPIDLTFYKYKSDL